MTKFISGGFDLRTQIESLPEDPRLADQWLVPTNRNRVSADPTIWPMPPRVSEYSRDTLGTGGYPLGCLNHFSELIESLHQRGVVTADFTPVCLTICEATAAALRASGHKQHFANACDEKELMTWGWRFLGFDIAQLNGLCSGLKGCGYREPSWSELRARFGGTLNAAGLFSDETIASEFAELRGREISHHAPFEVVGIFVHNPR